MRVKNVTRRPPSIRSAREGFDRGNRLAARVILSDMAEYGGEGSLPVTWARMIETKQARRIEGPLFQQAGQRYGRRAA